MELPPAHIAAGYPTCGTQHLRSTQRQGVMLAFKLANGCVVCGLCEWMVHAVQDAIPQPAARFVGLLLKNDLVPHARLFPCRWNLKPH